MAAQPARLTQTPPAAPTPADPAIVAAGLARLVAPVSPPAPIGEWQQRLRAVQARLAGPAATATGDAAVRSRMEDELLECLALLDRLDGLLADELARQRQQDLDVAGLRAALAQARAESAVTQVDVLHRQHTALHDSLTSLPNRSFFRDRLHAALAHADRRRAPVAVLVLDLDGFRHVNDTHGRALGDELLRIVAARLMRAVRAEDLVSRLGDDRFAMLVVNSVGRDKLAHLAAKLFDVVSAPLQVVAVQLVVRPSIGIALSSSDGEGTEALLSSAQAAMDRAKQTQAGFAFFDDLACTPRRV